MILGTKQALKCFVFIIKLRIIKTLSPSHTSTYYFRLKSSLSGGYLAAVLN